MKVLINVLDLDKQGGVANYYRALKDKFSIEVDYFTIGARSSKKLINLKPLRLILDYLAFAKMIKSNNYDLVLLNPSLNLKSIFRDAIFCQITKKYQKPFVIFFRGWDRKFEKFIENYFLTPFKSIFFTANAMLTLGNEFSEKLREWGYLSPIYLETTAVDNALLNGFSQENIYQKFNQPKEKFTILFLSRIEKSKGIIEVIDTFQILNQKYSHLELIIAGEGDYLTTIQEYVVRKGLHDVKFTGHVIDSAKKEIFEQADLFFFPTNHGEGMPNSLLEALAFGLPVITCPVGGISDFFENEKMGFYVDGLAPEKIASQIEKLIENPNLRLEMSLYNHEYAHKNFLAADVALRLEKIYRQIGESALSAGIMMDQLKSVEKSFHEKKYENRISGNHKIDLYEFEKINLSPEFEGSGQDRGVMRKFAFDLILKDNLKQKIVLDYACGDGRFGIFLALKGAKNVYGFDLSKSGVMTARQKILANSLTTKASYQVMDASSLAYKAESFDLCVGVGALHHVIKYDNIATELHRILKKGGKAIFIENLGDNKILEFLRKFSMKKLESAGEYILTRKDIFDFAKDFASVNIIEFSLFYMIKRVFRPLYKNKLIQIILKNIYRLDTFLLKYFPGLKKYCGEAVIVLIK